VAIVKFLISIGVDLNVKSFDEWLPIQLAIERKKMDMINLLIEDPSLNINLGTVRGLPLNIAVKSGNIAIVKKLLAKEINFSAKD
jgi:ankyrin repeat protein